MAMRTLVVNGETLTVRKGTYQDGNLALVLDADDEQYGKITVNLDVLPPEGFAYLDINNMPGIAELLTAAGAGGLAHPINSRWSGYVCYPLFEFSPSWLAEVDHV